MAEPSPMSPEERARRRLKDEEGDYIVTATWDEDAHLWVATSRDIPGLVVQARDPLALIAKVKLVAPALLSDNLQPFRRIRLDFQHFIEIGAAP